MIQKEKKEVVIKLTCTRKENAEFKESAESLGLSKTEYLQNLIRYNRHNGHFVPQKL
jgi:hypothetical protein